VTGDTLVIIRGCSGCNPDLHPVLSDSQHNKLTRSLTCQALEPSCKRFTHPCKRFTNFIQLGLETLQSNLSIIILITRPLIMRERVPIRVITIHLHVHWARVPQLKLLHQMLGYSCPADAQQLQLAQTQEAVGKGPQPTAFAEI
jgi:hypothetical protein